MINEKSKVEYVDVDDGAKKSVKGGRRVSKASKIKVGLFSALSLALVLGMSGCSSDGSRSDQNGTQASQNMQSSQATTSSSESSDELDLSFSKRDLDYSYDADSATKIELSNSGIDIVGDGASAEGSTLTLSAAGTYILNGSLSDGEIIVSAGDEDKLQIVFDGLSVNNANGPAMLVNNADKVFITVADGTQNHLSDGTEYDLEGDDDNRDGALFSRDDLTINGTGELTVEGNYSHAIVSKDDLVIAGPTMIVESKEDGMQGDDCVKIAEGDLTIDAGDDAIKSDTVVYIKDGTIDVRTCSEGYEAEKVIIDGGTHNIFATDDAINAALSTDSSSSTTMSDLVNAGNGMAFEGEPPNAPSRGSSSVSEIDSVVQTVKAPGQQNGSFGQQRNLGSNNGSGNGSRDDGGSMPGNDRGMMDSNMGRFGGNGMPQSSNDCLVQINGGVLTLTGGADGIDSNGNVEINGGIVMVCGPNSGMDGSLDYDLSAQVNGGTVLMTGSLGSTNGLDLSEQPWMIASIQGSKGSTVSLMDADGNELASMSATQSFGNVFVSSDQIKSGSSFTITVNGSPVSLTMK